MNKDDKLTKREKHLHSHMITPSARRGQESIQDVEPFTQARRYASAAGTRLGCVSKGSGEGCFDLSARTPRE